jgi:hypothetical protein
MNEGSAAETASFTGATKLSLMNLDTRLPSSRLILAVLVLAPIVSTAVNQIYQALSVGVFSPLLRMVFGSKNFPVMLGPFELGLVLSSLVSALFTIVLGTFLALFVLRISWRFIWPALAKFVNEGE